MNIIYKTDDSIDPETALIKTNSNFKDLRAFLDHAKSYNNKLTVKKNDNTYLIDISEFIRFYSSSKSVYAQTSKDEFQISKRLYELEVSLPLQFVRVSNSEIINLDHVSHFSLSMGGIINIHFKNGVITSSSRRYLKRVKEILYHEK